MGNGILLCAACISGLCAILLLLPKDKKRIRMIATILWCISSILVVFANVLMVVYQVFSRFEFQYVYNHTSQNTALIYKISALWSGQEGSFLLWALVLSIMGVFVLRIKGKGSNRAFGVYAAISFCIFLMCFISQPFEKMTAIPQEGLGLNKALQDPWMVAHPPLVFISYSAMAVLFSLSALLYKDECSGVSKQIRTWLRISWFFLGIGIVTGSVWAYRALGWGGYWSWDPIENAALVPWLILCAFLHENEYCKRSVCLAPFSIACFGVFLARSGILKDRSTHAYTSGNSIVTIIILGFILGTLLFLVISKHRNNKKERIKNKFTVRDKRLITYILYAYAAFIFIGTVIPLLLNTETPILYYIVISIVFALGYSVLLLIWDFEQVKKRYMMMIVASTVLVIGIMAVSQSMKIWWYFLLWVCLLPLSLWAISGFRQKSGKYYLSHLGGVLLIVGAITSTTLSKDLYAKASLDCNNVLVAGIQIPLKELIENDTLIQSLPQTDIIIHCREIRPLSDGGLFIPYTTKPFILLFWIGCFAITVLPFVYILIKRLLYLFRSDGKHLNKEKD